MKKLCLLAVLSAAVLFGAGILIFGDSELGETNRKCELLAEGERAQCWEKMINSALEEKGVDEAMEVFANLHDTQSLFMSICHDISHTIGQAGYREFAANRTFEVTEKSAYCNYGFYHGLMETMVAIKSGVTQARDFCDFVHGQIGEVIPDASVQCYHGIGHGWSNVHDNPQAWGDAPSIAAPALELCRAVTESPTQRSRCENGVFHGISEYMTHGEYGLSVNREDPLWLCREQPELYKKECYISMYGVLMSAGDRNFLRAAQFIESIDEDNFAAGAVFHLASAQRVYKSVRESDYADIIRVRECRALEKRLRVPCIQGYAFGLFEHGPSGEEYKRPILFCLSPMLSEQERLSCMEYIFDYLGIWYSKEKARGICETAEPLYREVCRY